MNKLTIIGNLTADPQTKTVNTSNGQVSVCSFTVAVNSRNGNEKAATYFNVNAWRQLGENCQKYLAKGRKAAVVGTVSARAYKDHNGDAKAVLEVNASEVEFLSSRADDAQETVSKEAQQASMNMNGTSVPSPEPMPVLTDDLPF